NWRRPINPVRTDPNRPSWALRVAQEFQPDIIVWHYHYPIPVFENLVTLHCPAIQHIQLRFNMLSSMSEQELATLFHRASHFVCEGIGIRNELHDLAGIALDRISMIPMPLDLNIRDEQLKVPMRVTRRDLGIAENAIVVASLGTP